MVVDSHRRPVAPVRIGSDPWRAVESIRLSVKLIRALIAFTAGAAAAWWSALASDSRAGTGPLPAAAKAIAVPPATAITSPAMIASRRWVEMVRRSFITAMTFLVSCDHDRARL